MHGCFPLFIQVVHSCCCSASASSCTKHVPEILWTTVREKPLLHPPLFSSCKCHEDSRVSRSNTHAPSSTSRLWPALQSGDHLPSRACDYAGKIARSLAYGCSAKNENEPKPVLSNLQVGSRSLQGCHAHGIQGELCGPCGMSQYV